MTELRPELPPMPRSMQRLPVGDRGYPIPYFVAWLDEEQNPLPRGEGTPDFRITQPGVVEDCWLNERCWVCGYSIDSRYRAFVAGPMCAINRTSSEPPSHIECARFSAIACPFLVRPHAKRREAGLPEAHRSPGGFMLERNPGVAMVWVSRPPFIKLRQTPKGTLFNIGEPERVEWYAEGREATRAEVRASIDSGLPALEELAAKQPGADEELARMVADAKAVLP